MTEAGLSLPYIAVLVALAVACVLLAVIVLAPTREPETVSVAAGPRTRDRTPAEPAALAQPVKQPAKAAMWPCMLDMDAADLPFDDRLALVKRLGLIGDDWCAPILSRAMREETDPRMLDALAAALQASRYE